MRRSLELAIVALGACGHTAVAPDAATTAADATSADAIAADAPDGKVGVFVAQGDVGRTIFSCDDGMTWIGNHSWDEGDPMMCNQVETVVCGTSTQCPFYVHDACTQLGCCNESPGQPHGVVYGNGSLVSVWGHGAPGAIRTSSDGRTWTTTYPDLPTSVVAFGAGTFVTAHTKSAIVSTDGTTWAAGGALPLSNNDGPRAIGYGAGRFVVLASAGGVGELAVTTREIVVTSDAGATWWHPTMVPDDCAIGVGGGDIIEGNGVFLIADEKGTICRSADGGDTWATVATGVSTVASSVMAGSTVVWTGSEFELWGQHTMLASPDGLTWISIPMTTTNAVRAVARSNTGAYVTATGAYAGQKLLRSTDGLTWQEIAFPPSHAIAHVAYLRVDPGTLCP